MSLEGKRVAIMLDQKYQELEVWYPLYRLIEAGALAASAQATVSGSRSERAMRTSTAAPSRA